MDRAPVPTGVGSNCFVGVRETGLDSTGIKALLSKPSFATIQHSDSYDEHNCIVEEG